MYLHKSKIKQVTERDSWIKLAKCNIPPPPIGQKVGVKKNFLLADPPTFKTVALPLGQGQITRFRILHPM